MFEVVTNSKTGEKQIIQKITNRLIATLGPTVTDLEASKLAAAPGMYLFLIGHFPYDKDYIVARAEGRELIVKMSE